MEVNTTYMRYYDIIHIHIAVVRGFYSSPYRLPAALNLKLGSSTGISARRIDWDEMLPSHCGDDFVNHEKIDPVLEQKVFHSSLIDHQPEAPTNRSDRTSFLSVFLVALVPITW